MGEVKTIKRLVSPQKVYAMCDCGEILKRVDTIVLTSNPPMYVYKCPKCMNVYNLRNIYPYIEYVEDV